jgi:hypothetical protein
MSWDHSNPNGARTHATPGENPVAETAAATGFLYGQLCSGSGMQSCSSAVLGES